MMRTTSRSALARLATYAATVVTLALLVAAADAPTTRSAPADDQLLDPKPIDDPKTGLTFRIPKGWVPKQGITSTGFEAPAKDRVAAGGLAPSILVNRDATPGIKPADVAAVVAAKKKQYAESFAEYQEVNDAPPVPALAGTDGKGVAAIDCTHTVAKVLPLRVRQIWIVDNDVIYTLTCTSIAETYPRNEKAFEAALKSVRVP